MRETGSVLFVLFRPGGATEFFQGAESTPAPAPDNLTDNAMNFTFTGCHGAAGRRKRVQDPFFHFAPAGRRRFSQRQKHARARRSLRPIGAEVSRHERSHGLRTVRCVQRPVLHPWLQSVAPLGRKTDKAAVQPEGLKRNSPRATPWVNVVNVHSLLCSVFVQALKRRHGRCPRPHRRPGFPDRRHGLPFVGRSARHQPSRPFYEQRRPVKGIFPRVGRVEVWRGGGRSRGVAVSGGFRPTPVPRSVPCSVSRPRSSNRTCGFPASGSRRRRHAFAHGHLHPSLTRGAPPAASGSSWTWLRNHETIT